MVYVVACVVGTRPEAVKMAPVILRLRRPDSVFVCRVLSTGQHRDLIGTALAEFGLCPDAELDTMRNGQGLAQLTARLLLALDQFFSDQRPDLVLAQGDTTSVLCLAMACHYHRIPFAHIEAGLRTGQPYRPFPEEKNRVLVSHLAELHFAPTEGARRNLLREGIQPDAVIVTGNTVIDALRMIDCPASTLPGLSNGSRYILVTAHRRENWGKPLEQLGLALRDLIRDHADLHVVLPLHINSTVRASLRAILGGLDRIILTEALGYREFVALMKGARIILTDSGGVQEEGVALGKPVLILRDETERPEGLATGLVQIVGTSRTAIVAAVHARWHAEAPNPTGEILDNPFGDGQAAERIYRTLARRFGIEAGPGPAGLWDWQIESRRALSGFERT